MPEAHCTIGEVYALSVRLPDREYGGNVVCFTLVDFRRSMAKAHTYDMSPTYHSNNGHIAMPSTLL